MLVHGLRGRNGALVWSAQLRPGTRAGPIAVAPGARRIAVFAATRRDPSRAGPVRGAAIWLLDRTAGRGVATRALPLPADTSRFFPRALVFAPGGAVQ
jgi:hypothetical protein